MIARKAVEIVWEDSHLSVGGWHSRKSHLKWAKQGHCRIVTVGLLTKKTKYFLTVVQSVGQDQVNAAIKIPRTCVVSMRVLARYPDLDKGKK